MRGKFLQKGAVFVVSAAVVLSTYVAAASTAAAQTETGSESITLSPVNKRYNVDAGQVVNDELTIINDGAIGYDFIVYARPYSVQSEAYDPNFTATPSNADVYRWIQFSTSQFRLEAGESIKVPYTMRVPADSPPGGHYGVLFAETQPTSDASGESVVRKKRVGSIIYATVNGKYRLEGTLQSNTTTFWQFRPPMTTTSVVKNSGNTDFVDSITFTVKDVFGNVKHTTQKEYPVLPDTTRKITLQWDEAPWFGLFKVDTAHAFLDTSSTTSAYVLMVPRWLLIILIVALAGGAIYAILRRRR